MPPDDWIADALNKASTKETLGNFKAMVMGMVETCKGIGWDAVETTLYFQSITPAERYGQLPLIAYWVGLAYKEGK
jgi:hypothetical protein